jgi:fucose permease
LTLSFFYPTQPALILLSSLPLALTGCTVTLETTLNSIATLMSTEENRILRMTIYDVLMNVGSASGLYLGSTVSALKI